MRFKVFPLRRRGQGRPVLRAGPFPLREAVARAPRVEDLGPIVTLIMVTMQSINLPSILTPDLGLLFWMLLAFLIVFFLMAKFGFPVITKMVEERKQFIDESLQKAHEANERLAGIREESERLLSEARARQAEILSQAKATGDGIVREARERAQAEGAKLLQEAKAQIEAEKENALRDIRETVADLSVAIAEKVVRQHLADDKEQQKLIERMLDEVC